VGRPVEKPPGTTLADRLLWTFHHQCGMGGTVATLVLGARSEHRAIRPMLALFGRAARSTSGGGDPGGLVTGLDTVRNPEKLSRVGGRPL
jgi:hypothetical protein